MRPRTKRINVILYISTKINHRRNVWTQAIKAKMKEECLPYKEAKDKVLQELKWRSINREFNQLNY